MNHGRHRYSPFPRTERDRPYRDDEPERRRRPGDTILAEDDPVLDWGWDSVQKILRHIRGCRTCDDYVYHLQRASGDRGFEQASLQREFNIQQVHGYALERGRQEAEEHRVTIRQLTDEIAAIRKERDDARADFEDEKEARLKLEDELDDYHRGRSVTRSPSRSAYTPSRSGSQSSRADGRRRSHSPRTRSHSPGPRRKTRSLSARGSRSPKSDVEMKLEQPSKEDSAPAATTPAVTPSASLLERMNVVATGSPSLLSRIAGPHAESTTQSLLMRISENPGHAAPSLLMRMADEPMAPSEGEGTGTPEKDDNGINTLPRPEEYEPGLGFLRKDQSESSPIKDKAQLRWPNSKDEARRLAAEAMRDGRRLALEHWGLFLRAANLGEATGPAADAARAMGWRKPAWVAQEHERRKKRAQDRAMANKDKEEKHDEVIKDPPPFTSTYIQRWTVFLKQHPEFKIPGVLRNDDGAIAAGKEDTLAGFLRVMELGPAPYYGPRMREWLRAVLEADWRDGSLLDNVRDLRGTESFPNDRTISIETVRDFFLALTPPIAERLNQPQPDRAMASIRSWTFSLCLMVPERFEIKDEVLDAIFGDSRLTV